VSETRKRIVIVPDATNSPICFSDLPEHVKDRWCRIVLKLMREKQQQETKTDEKEVSEI
jgi:hypothetical protein